MTDLLSMDFLGTFFRSFEFSNCLTYSFCQFLGERSKTYCEISSIFGSKRGFWGKRKRCIAVSHKDTSKWFNFFRPWQSFLLILFKTLNISAPISRICFWFLDKYTTGSWSIASQKSGCRNFFGDDLANKVQFSAFLEIRRITFYCSLYTKPWNSNFLALTDGRPVDIQCSRELWHFC